MHRRETGPGEPKDEATTDTSDALGVFLLIAGAAMLVPAAVFATRPRASP
jgi:hypothetical protein